MADMKRITPQEIVEAYRKTGLGIVRGEYVSDDGKYGCGLGAYALAFLGVSLDDALGDDDDVYETYMHSGIGSAYHNGFAVGFDGGPRKPRPIYGDRDVERYNHGHEDGEASYAAAKEAARV